MQKVRMELRPSGRIARPDAKGRICLGELAEGVSSYAVFTDPSSQRIILEPRVEIPVREAWLFTNKDALASVRRGLEQSAAGEVRNLGSFVEYASDEDDAQ